MKRYRITRTETYEAFMEAESKEEVETIIKYRAETFSWRKADSMVLNSIEEVDEDAPITPREISKAVTRGGISRG